MKSNPQYRNLVRKFYLLSLIFLAMSGPAAAAMVRGRLERMVNGSQRAPAAGVTVTVRIQSSGRSSPVASGQDGMYYIYNVPAGSHYLEVWLKGSNSQPTVYRIEVHERYTDIPAIIVR